MRKEVLTNKDGEELKTKKGETLVDYHLEVGDEFIPVYNAVRQKEHKASVKGKETLITNNILKIKTKDEGEIFVNLTAGQAKVFKNRVDEGCEPNQHVWIAYEYENKYGKQVGITVKKDFKDPIDFPEDKKEE